MMQDNHQSLGEENQMLREENRVLQEENARLRALVAELLSKESKQQTSRKFRLPEEWQERAIQLHPFSVNLLQKPQETIRQTLETYFAPLAEMKHKGVGGQELMVAMNEDFIDEKENNSGQRVITAYSPASFNFQLATGENSLVTHILQETIGIVEVIIGDDSSDMESIEITL